MSKTAKNKNSWILYLIGVLIIMLASCLHFRNLVSDDSLLINIIIFLGYLFGGIFIYKTYYVFYKLSDNGYFLVSIFAILLIFVPNFHFAFVAIFSGIEFIMNSLKPITFLFYILFSFIHIYVIILIYANLFFEFLIYKKMANLNK
ncbi:hypothetical protein OFO07_06855 [Campylobacter sp. JMF_06 NA1]|uniref:hypothetical protein n=1 Tax=Campylobacter sp. JMF_06 NA1 TaxID=2983823 RepID=UPI0022EA0B8C|nr:hypothetical protein [Campylobacter sp. JMF_06 NA1]MDA3078636.1 hypothetical protein [Campylobacter sp. JMF_06 NA1]